MTNNGYAYFAEALVFAHGPQALCEAKRHATLCAKSGDMDMAAHWQATISVLREHCEQPARKASRPHAGPHVSLECCNEQAA